MTAPLRARFPAPVLMGVVNVTPDSFSDGGRFLDPDAATAEALRHLAAGAAIIDVGGESTRPGAVVVSVDEEIRRVVPAIRAIRAATSAPISVDTSKAVVAEQAIAAGATFVNDVTALGDPAMAGVVARAGVDLCLMHMQGSPGTMQLDPRYGDVVAEVGEELARCVEQALAAGIPRERICVDPGIGFGKTVEHNLALLRSLRVIAERCDAPVLVAVSRKRFLARLIGDEERDRTAATVACGLLAVEAGAWMLRVHDVQPHADALAVLAAVTTGAPA